MTPLLKTKVDELFLHWFSDLETQQQLRKDLKSIIGGSHISAQDRPSSPTTNLSLIGLNLNARPSSPPIPPSSPTTPRSPRTRKISRKSSKKSLRQSVHEEKRGVIFPGCAKDIKQFYFPYGEPNPINTLPKIKTNTVEAITSIFEKLPNNVANLTVFGKIVKACNWPLYWKYPFYHYCSQGLAADITCQQAINAWKKISSLYHDDASQFFHMLLRKDKTYLESEDFEGLLQDIINAHPGLQFLVEAPEFHSRYIITVISRIFYTINRKWNMKLTLPEFRRSNFIAVIQKLEEEDDINQIIDFFSYEHFYVIYCKFWELDTDHDMVISKDDLSRYSNSAISNCMIDRLFSGCVTRGTSFVDGHMSYVDFVWFILSEVDKTTTTGIEYWFRCMDINGDGIISLYEMEYFYSDQLKKMEDLGMEVLAFEDCLCQTLDLIKPESDNTITLRDVKQCKLSPVFFDTFFNLDKWLEHEQKDPFQSSKDDGESESVWDRYVNIEYELLVAEEGGCEDIEYEDDFDTEDENNIDEILKPLEPSNYSDELGPRWSVVSAVADNSNNNDDNNDDDDDGGETFY